jgi:hypothetical protein
MVMSQVGEYPRAFSRVRRPAVAPVGSPGSVGAYDYAASFKLKGIPGNIVQDVINVSSDGVFVAVAIGYGLEEERGQPITITIATSASSIVAKQVTLDQIPVEALITGFRLNPGVGAMVPFDQELPVRFATTLLQRMKPPEDISFLFSVVDSASGRELQDEPTHNLASLGKSNGERPFRQLAQPLTFLPRSTIRMQIVERSEGVKGTLFIVLYGYKLLGASSCPEPLMRRLHGSPACPTESIGRPSDRVVPFDYVARVELSGQPGALVEAEVPINVEGGFVATAIGYGLEAEQGEIPLTLPPGLINVPANGPEKTFKLSQLPLSSFPQDKLRDGVRMRADFLRLAFAGGKLSDEVRVSLAGKIFESLNRPENVSFRYSIFDSGTGRELQNQPVHNIAGLGIANGDRPFKKFARPMIFLPRSAIRVIVQEHFGRGTLFCVFQGYKVLGLRVPGSRR